jgi:uncharacterized protein DUF4388/type II secretion system (T2SS) protein E
MDKTARLDQILLRLGYADQEQFIAALARQESHGGRLGTNLVQLGAITEAQLLEALAEQFRVPTVVPQEQNISAELLDRMPDGVVVEHLMLPLSWNEDQRVLNLAVANPGDEEVIGRVKESFGAKAVRVALASEALLSEIARNLVGVDEESVDAPRSVELPELFEPEDSESREPASPDGEAVDRPRVLMITAGPTRKNFLPPVFQREGVDLTVVTEVEDAASELAGDPADAILLSEEMEEVFAGWIRDGLVQAPRVEVTVFTSVSDALLKNPLPYDAVVASLKSGVQALADYRCAEHGVSPPYGLVASDVEALAENQGVGRVAADGLTLALHLLLPAPGDDPVGAAEPFLAFPSSLELASRIRFSWRLDAVIAACHGLYTGRTQPAGAGGDGDGVLLAAQILAITWFRHNHGGVQTGEGEEEALALRTAMRDKAGSLASLELIEAYLRLITERVGVAKEGGGQVLLVGEERISRALAPALTRLGCEALPTGDLADAQTMAERRPPAAIVVDHDVFSEQVDKFSRVVKLGGAALLFVLTDSTDPSLVLNLLDVGVDDVFGPPHDYDLVAARVNRAIGSRARERPSEKAPAGQFSATFEAFSFLDLAQMLGQGLKTVRIDLSRSDGEEAVLYMQKGRFTHATCGESAGTDAVYRVIAWEDDGEFTVREETTFPEASIEESTESVLMEGLRLLDESKRG